MINESSNNNKTHNISVGTSPNSIADNPTTNKIYITNLVSNSVSVIDSLSDKLAVGVKLVIHPANSGKIFCKINDIDNEYPSGIYLFLDTGTICRAESNKDFQFTGWVKNLDQNSTIRLNDIGAELTVNRFGTFTANFKPLPPPIPPEYLAPLYAIIISTSSRMVNTDSRRENQGKKSS